MTFFTPCILPQEGVTFSSQFSKDRLNFHKQTQVDRQLSTWEPTLAPAILYNLQRDATEIKDRKLWGPTRVPPFPGCLLQNMAGPVGGHGGRAACLLPGTALLQAWFWWIVPECAMAGDRRWEPLPDAESLLCI